MGLIGLSFKDWTRFNVLLSASLLKKDIKTQAFKLLGTCSPKTCYTFTWDSLRFDCTVLQRLNKVILTSLTGVFGIGKPCGKSRRSTKAWGWHWSAESELQLSAMARIEAKRRNNQRTWKVEESQVMSWQTVMKPEKWSLFRNTVTPYSQCRKVKPRPFTLKQELTCWVIRPRCYISTLYAKKHGSCAAVWTKFSGTQIFIINN